MVVFWYSESSIRFAQGTRGNPRDSKFFDLDTWRFWKPQALSRIWHTRRSQTLRNWLPKGGCAIGAWDASWMDRCPALYRVQSPAPEKRSGVFHAHQKSTRLPTRLSPYLQYDPDRKSTRLNS